MVYQMKKGRVSILIIFLLLIILFVSLPGIQRKIKYAFTDPCSDITFRLLSPPFTSFLTVDHDSGQLGDKMFKYASLLGIAKRHGRWPFVLPYSSEVDLQKIFSLTHVEFHSETCIQSWPVVSETQYAYDDPVIHNLTQTNLTIQGYLQSWKYFNDITQEIRGEFLFLPQIREEALKILQEIRDSFSRTDRLTFIGVQVSKLHENAHKNSVEASKAYYYRAFKEMANQLPQQKLIFVVTGNDLTWIRQYLSGNDIVVLDSAPDYIHLAVLVRCDHIILSTGAFGWWAGWLAGGKVIYYSTFPGPGSPENIGFVHKDYYPEHWIGMGDWT